MPHDVDFGIARLCVQLLHRVLVIARLVEDSAQGLDLCRVIGCVTAMKMRLRTLLHGRRSTAYAVGSYANSMKGVTCDPRSSTTSSA
jgi:tetrahydromethanopterin S-methyltransferase subunit D